MSLRIAIRVDSSTQIGTGHFMRCLTLADELVQRGAQVRFISRHILSYLLDMLTKKGIEFMPLENEKGPSNIDELPHAHWLEVSQQQDAQATVKAISDQSWDWLIVDHYALDIRWELVLRNSVQKIFVIDDIADRRHDCDMLLDQNFYKNMEIRYKGLISSQCTKLFGPNYALLRREFIETRKRLRKRDGKIKKIFVSFGGSDPTNETVKALEAIHLLGKTNIEVDVVIGTSSIHRETIATICDLMQEVKIHYQVSNMAELMANADLSIGAGGATTWERLGFKEGQCPEAERYYAEAISLPMYSGLTEIQQNEVVMGLRDATNP